MGCSIEIVGDAGETRGPSRCARDDNVKLETDVRLEEGVGVAFFAYCRGGAVAWDYVRFVGEGEKAVVEGAEDLVRVAAGQVGAADGSGEKRVSGEEQVFRREVEADAAFGVAWGAEDTRGVAGDPDCGAVFEGAVGGKDLRRGDAEPGGLLVHYGELGKVVLVQKNGCAGGFFQAGRAADMVDVPVGDDDLFEGEIVVGQAREDLGYVVAGVDDHGFAGGLVAEDGAVALEGADGEGFADHGYQRTSPQRTQRSRRMTYQDEEIARGKTGSMGYDAKGVARWPTLF